MIKGERNVQEKMKLSETGKMEKKGRKGETNRMTN